MNLNIVREENKIKTEVKVKQEAETDQRVIVDEQLIMNFEEKVKSEQIMLGCLDLKKMTIEDIEKKFQELLIENQTLKTQLQSKNNDLIGWEYQLEVERQRSESSLQELAKLQQDKDNLESKRVSEQEQCAKAYKNVMDKLSSAESTNLKVKKKYRSLKRKHKKESQKSLEEIKSLKTECEKSNEARKYLWDNLNLEKTEVTDLLQEKVDLLADKRRHQEEISRLKNDIEEFSRETSLQKSKIRDKLLGLAADLG